MLGVALTAQRAGWGDVVYPPLVVQINNTSTLGYGIEQSPAFYWTNSENTSPSTNFVNKWYPGNIDTTGYTGQANYGNRNWCYLFTFKIDYAAGLTTNQGMKFDTRFRGNSGDGDFTTNWAWVVSSGGKLQINSPFGPAITLDEAYGNYNGRWMTVVSSSAASDGSYANWGTVTSGDYFQRTAVFDTGTGELLKKVDEATFTRNSGFPGNIASWLANANNTISTDRSDSFSYSINISGATANANLALTNQWVSIGTMFDPIKATNDGDSTWRTTRPHKVISTGNAWMNIQYTNYSNSASQVDGWISASDSDLFTSSDGVKQAYLQIAGNSTTWSDRFSDTNLPVWTG